MKHSLLLGLLATILFFFAVGCHRQAVETEYPPLEKWLTDDTEAALRYVNKTCTAFYFNKQNDSVMNLYSRMFRSFPHNPTGSVDTLVKEVGIALAYYNNAAFYSRNNAPFVNLFDSLRHSGHPFLTGPCLGYVLAYQAYVQIRSDKENAQEPARAFVALPPQTDLSQELMCCHLVSWVLWNGGASADVYIPMQLRAVEAFRQGGKLANITGVLSRLSFYYRTSGQYDKAIDYSLQALDWELTNNGGKKNAGTIQMYGDLSSIYSQLFLFDKAFEMLDLAILSSRAYNNSHMCDLYRMKASLFERTEATDSMFHYMNLAIQEADKMKDFDYIYTCAKEKAYYFVRNCSLYADSLPHAVKKLEQCYADSAAVSPQQHMETRLWYGRALTCIGQAARGKQLMEQAVNEIKEMKWDEGVYDAYGELTKFYAEQGMGRELTALFPAYVAMRDSVEKEEKVNASIAADVRYETGRKEQENRALAAEVSLKERSLTYMRIILTLSVILLLAAGYLIVQHRRMRRREQDAHRSQITSLLSAQQELNRRNEALSGELEQIAHTEVIDTVRQQLNPILLSGDDEIRFRQSFAALYPRYLPKLRTTCPELTKSDELVCMLVHLKQSTDEVSLALGISRASVNSARSRIRKKLGLQKEESLDKYLQEGVS